MLRSARPAWVLIGLAIAFIVFMNLGAKKLDRYILPAVPLHRRTGRLRTLGGHALAAHAHQS